MKLLKKLESLCLPARVYFIMSMLSILALFIQNCSNQNMYCIGTYKTYSDRKNIIYFLFKIFYILVWTWLLNSFCRKGYTNAAWIIVLLPFILMLVGIVVLFLHLDSKI